MKRDWNQLNLRDAYRPVPDAFRKTAANVLNSLAMDETKKSAPSKGKRFGGRIQLKTIVLIAVSVFLVGMAAAYALSRPAILNWLLGFDAQNQPYPAGSALNASVQSIQGEGKADHITVRITSLIYDGERIAFSYEIENDDPAYPAMVALDGHILINGEEVRIDEFQPDGIAPRLVPSARLDVLPVRRNPAEGGGWSEIISRKLDGMADCELQFIVYRPRKAFAVVPDPEDKFFSTEDGAGIQAEIQDVINTYQSFRNAVIADRDSLDPEKWFQDGYSVIGGFQEPTEWIDPNEEGFDHLAETAKIAVKFHFDANIRQVYDFSNLEEISLPDCTGIIKSLRFSPLTTEVDLFLLPVENTEEAARKLVQKYGNMRFTDEKGDDAVFAQMESMYETAPWASLYEGQWRCRYMIRLPGLQEWPKSVGIALQTGEILRVKLANP